MTLTAIRKGLAATALVASMAACGGDEPEPSPTPDSSPGDGAEPTTAIAPHSGYVGSDVQIQASGFEAGQEVGIGFGPPNSEFDVFQVTEEDGTGGVRVTGVLTDEGVECQALRAASGTLYTLAGDTGAFRVGDRVEVRGAIAEISYCQQGTTINVEAITAAG